MASQFENVTDFVTHDTNSYGTVLTHEIKE